MTCLRVMASSVTGPKEVSASSIANGKSALSMLPSTTSHAPVASTARPPTAVSASMNTACEGLGVQEAGRGGLRSRGRAGRSP